MKLLQTIVIAAAAVVAAPVVPYDSRWDEMSPLVEPPVEPPSAGAAHALPDGIVVAVESGYGHKHGSKGPRPPWVHVVSKPSYVRPMANHPDGGPDDKRRPSGRFGELLEKLGISPPVEWSHRPATGSSEGIAPAAADPHHRHHGHGHGSGHHCRRPFAAIVRSFRALYNSLGDQRTYATVMFLIALMNFATIALVLYYFRARRREGQRRRSETRRLEAAPEYTVHDISEYDRDEKH